MNHRPGAGRRLGLVEHAVDQALAADLLDVAERLFLDGGEAAGDVALGRLRVGQVARLVPVDDLLVAVEHELEFLAHLVVAAARGDQVLAAGELGGLAEHQRHAVRVELVEGVADGGVGAAARGGVGLAALGGDPQVLERALLAAQLARPLQVFARRLRGAHDGVVVAVPLDAEEGHRLAGLARCRRRPSSPSRPRCRSPPPRRRSGSSRCRSACGSAGRGRRRTAAARRDAAAPSCP